MRRKSLAALLLLTLVLALSLVLPKLVSAGDGDPESRHGSATPAEGADAEEDDWEDFDDEEEGVAGSSREVARAQKALPQINDQNAERILNSTEYVLLLGYASWCKQSAAVMVDFAEAAAVLAAKGSPVSLAKIDAVANQATAKRYSIKGFPSVLFFTNGSAQIYAAGLTREDIVNWVQKRIGQAGTTFSTIAEAEDLRRRNATVVVGLFDKFEGPEYEEFIAASVGTDDVEFLQTTNSEAVKVFSLDLGDVAPAIGIWKSEPEYFLKFGAPLKSTDLVAFVALNKHPLVTKLNARQVAKIYASPVNKQVLLFANIDDYESLYPIYLAAAKDFKGELIFLWVDIADEDFAKPMMTMYGIPDSEPAVAGFDNNNGSRYLLESEVTSENLKAFATGFKEGRLKLHYKSEHIPKKNKGDVKVIVGKTFEKLVLKNSKDVLLLVYTPYCYDCDSMGKVFVKLAKHFKGASSIFFAKFDAAANEHPELQVNSYPSILFYSASSRNSPPVNGPSKPILKKLVQFVDENHDKLLSPARKEDPRQEEANNVNIDPSEVSTQDVKKLQQPNSMEAIYFELFTRKEDSESELSNVIGVEPLKIVTDSSVNAFEAHKVTSHEVPEPGHVETETIPTEVRLSLEPIDNEPFTRKEDSELSDVIGVEPLKIATDSTKNAFEAHKVTSYEVSEPGHVETGPLSTEIGLSLESKSQAQPSAVKDELQDTSTHDEF